jgi:glycogen(starch) synthase
VPDVVGEREALLVAPGDPEALAEGIHRALADPAAAAGRARAARARLDATFSAEPWLRAYETLYRELAPRPAMARTERARPALPPG